MLVSHYRFNKKKAGTWGEFELHPLKNINVWSDGGIITTNNKRFYNHLLLYETWIVDRDTVKIPGYILLDTMLR